MATIKEIKELLATVKELESPIFLELEKDNRSGVQKEISKRKKAIQSELDEDLRLESMLSYEKELYKQGLTLIAGVDEVGRGPLAGPVVAAAVILPKNCTLIGGWCEVYRKDRTRPVYREVELSAYNTGKNWWQKAPGQMIEKVAIVAAVRDSFSEDVGGLYTSEEMEQAAPILSLIHI